MSLYLVRGNHLPLLHKCCAATDWITMIKSKYIIDGCGFTARMLGVHNGYLRSLVNRGLVVHLGGTWHPYQYVASREVMEWYHGC